MVHSGIVQYMLEFRPYIDWGSVYVANTEDYHSVEWSGFVTSYSTERRSFIYFFTCIDMKVMKFFRDEMISKSFKCRFIYIFVAYRPNVIQLIQWLRLCTPSVLEKNMCVRPPSYNTSTACVTHIKLKSTCDLSQFFSCALLLTKANPFTW